MKKRLSLLILIYGTILIKAQSFSDNLLGSKGQSNCLPFQFQCQNGQCISNDVLCDGKADCSDKSDETHFECSSSKIRCHTYAFRCAYGACVDGDKKCNGVKDCIDGSDETGCPDSTLNSSSSLNSNCANYEFSCKNGQCISSSKICDGKVDCNDRSDETYQNCASFNCGGLAFRCAYGGCIDGDKKCNKEVDCADGSDEDPKLCRGTTTPVYEEITPVRPPIVPPRTPVYQPPVNQPQNPALRIPCRIPPQIEHGRWQLNRSLCPTRQECNVPPGIEFLDPGTPLVYTCQEGFKLDRNQEVFCGPQGQWANIPKCIEIRCESLNSQSTLAECTYRNRLISCETSVPIWTTAKLTCRSSYHEDNRQFLSTQKDFVRCNSSGHWEPEPIKCVAVCGLLNKKYVPHILNGKTAMLTDFPWHASLYMETGPNNIDFLCGATIVRANILISAAHCVYNPSRRRIHDASKFHIVAGNVLRDYNSKYHEEDVVVKVKVKDIYIQCPYTGFRGNYDRDIALILIEEPFMFTSVLMPVCLDTTGTKHQLSLVEGNFGKVAGFGRTATGSHSNILLTLTVPYVSLIKCRNVAAENEIIIPSDKFCAGYNNGSAVCDGDSGGGLVFNIGGLWYLEGIVSSSVQDSVEGGAQVCNPLGYTLYTQISKHIDWLQDIIINIEKNNPIPECPK